MANIQLLTGEDWAPIMFNYMESCGWMAAPFFVMMMLLYSFILMNLFTAIILQNFSISEHEKMNHQKQAYRDKRGQQAEEDDMSILEWLAEAADGDDAASKSIQQAMGGMHSTQESVGHCVEKFCGCCHVQHHEDPELAKLIEMQQRHLSLKSEESHLTKEHERVTKQIHDLDEEMAGPMGQGDRQMKLSEQHGLLKEEQKAIDSKHHTVFVDAQVLAENIENEQKFLKEGGKNMKHHERSKETGPHSYSCLCLQQNIIIRHFCHDLTNHWLFEGLIFAAIIASSACLAYHPDSHTTYIAADGSFDEVNVLGHFCTILFIVEFAMRVIDMNFVQYIKHGWNALDFVIVLAAILEYVLEFIALGEAQGTGVVDLSLLKIMRMLRLLRALRAIKHVEQLKVIVDVLVGCLPTVLAALAIVLIIYSCFGILGLSLFGGMFHRCECITDDCTDEAAMSGCLRMFYGESVAEMGTVVDGVIKRLDKDTVVDPCDLTPGHFDDRYAYSDSKYATRAAVDSGWNVLYDGVSEGYEHPAAGWKAHWEDGLGAPWDRDPLVVNMSLCCPGPEDRGYAQGIYTQSWQRGVANTSRTEACYVQVKREVFLKSNGTMRWANPPYNFDSIASAVQTMFYMATTEGWVDIMHSGQDVPDRPGLAPLESYNWTYCIYFVAFQMIGAAFSMSLFTGVLVNYFAESSGSGILTRKQQEWVHAKLLVLRAHAVTEQAPESAIRQAAHKLYTWQWWELVVSIVILIQVGVIVLVAYPSNKWVTDLEFGVNMACLLFFTFELILGILAMGFTSFIRSGWSKFDLVVVVLSWVAAAMEFFLSGESLPSVQALRATRIVRILTLFRGSQNLKALFAALVLSLPAVVNITLLMLLIFFVFGVLGMHLYASMPFGENLNEHENFNSSLDGMKLLFEVATGHDFLNTVHEMELNYEASLLNTTEVDTFGHPFAFFFVFYLAAAFILINLFVAMLLENVQISLASENSLIQAEHTDAFKKEWDIYVLDGKGKKKAGKARLCCYDVIALIKTLEEPLGRVDEIENWEHRLLLEMQVGLKRNRRQTFVTFESALMATCVLYLSNACLPYELQHSRMLDILHQQQETATRLIQCHCLVMIRCTRVPEFIIDTGGSKVMLDTPKRVQQYKTAVKVFGELSAAMITSTNRMTGLSNDAIKPRGEKTGEVKLKIERGADVVVVTVLETKGLQKMDLLGENDPYVIVGINSATQRTKTVNGGGEACTFDVKDDHAKLTFHHVTRVISVKVRVFDEDVGSAFTDDQIGVTVDLIDYFQKQREKNSNPDGTSTGRWVVEEEWFDIRRELHRTDKNVASRTNEDNQLREMILLANERDRLANGTGHARRTMGHGRSMRSNGSVDTLASLPDSSPRGGGSSDLESSDSVTMNPINDVPEQTGGSSMRLRDAPAEQPSDVFPEVEGEKKGNIATRKRDAMQKRLTMKLMDTDFGSQTKFYRVVQTAVIRTEADVTKAPIRGFLRAGDVVMGFETFDRAWPHTPRSSAFCLPC